MKCGLTSVLQWPPGESGCLGAELRPQQHKPAARLGKEPITKRLLQGRIRASSGGHLAARPRTRSFEPDTRAHVHSAGRDARLYGRQDARRYRSDLRGIRGCNLAIWRDDLLKVNGYNEAFTGWGREDSELAVRLMNTGARRLDVRGWAICYHLWHPPASRSSLPANDQLLQAAQAQKASRCDTGLSAHRPQAPR